ncbi:response regulator [Streptomyces sp. NPDC001635]|nr:response regulator transcription factor [Streptomyces sp. T1317-0309]
MIHVLLADDNEITRRGLAAIIESSNDIRVIAEAVNGRDAVDSAARTTPDIALVDLAMPEMDGLAATRCLLALPNPPRVIILTTFHEDSQVHDALTAGAAGFLLKDSAPADLLRAIRAVHDGKAVLGPAVTKRLLDTLAQPTAQITEAERNRLDALSRRERHVLRLLARGLSNAAIARELGMTEGTIKGHVSSILTKLNAASRVQAARLAYRAHLDTEDDSPSGLS